MRKTQIFINKPVYLSLSILQLLRIAMYWFWYDYVKSKYENYVICFIVYIKTDDIYEDLPEDVETRFDTSNYELKRPKSKEKNKKVIGLMKAKLGGKFMKEFVELRTKTYN